MLCKLFWQPIWVSAWHHADCLLMHVRVWLSRQSTPVSSFVKMSVHLNCYYAVRGGSAWTAKAQCACAFNESCRSWGSNQVSEVNVINELWGLDSIEESLVVLSHNTELLSLLQTVSHMMCKSLHPNSLYCDHGQHNFTACMETCMI